MQGSTEEHLLVRWAPGLVKYYSYYNVFLTFFTFLTAQGSEKLPVPLGAAGGSHYPVDREHFS